MLRLLRPPRRLCAHPTHPLRVPRPPPPLPSGGAQLRAFASYQRRPVVREPGAEGGSGSARRGLGGWLKAGAKAIVLLGGFLFWGTLTLEWLLVWLSPEEAEAMLREEEREEQATAAFFGLRSMLRDPDVLDDEYFSALAERKRLLCAYPTPSAPRAHGQRAVTDGWRRVRSGRICARSSGTTRRSSRSSARGARCRPWCAAAPHSRLLDRPSDFRCATADPRGGGRRRDGRARGDTASAGARRDTAVVPTLPHPRRGRRRDGSGHGEVRR